MLGLPDSFSACLFDLDGVLTRTAAQHEQAWKEMFDDVLRQWSEQAGEPLEPFELASRGLLAGQPAPDTFLAGARLLQTEPPHAAVEEDDP